MKKNQKKVLSFRPDDQCEEIVEVLQETYGLTLQELMSDLIKRYGPKFLDELDRERMEKVRKAKERISGKSLAAVAA